MLLTLLLLAAQTAPASDAGLSPELRTLVATQESLAPGEFVRRVTALAEGGDASAAE